MSPEISERAFEETIECALLQHGPDACPGDSTAVRETPPPYGDTPPGGYRRRKPDDYDRTLCLLPHDVVDFMLATQPKEWKKLEQHHGAAVRERFLKRLATEIERRGALDVLRGGIKDSGCKFRLAYFRPASGLNEETRRLHAANLFAAVRQFIHEVEEDDEKGRKTGKRSLIFPRYQQLDCVRKLVTDARAAGAGRRYLIQHSAGSGKSFTIAWLAHQLATLHDADDRRVFDSIVVITDRRVLDRQLQTTMRQFEQTLGVVENIDSTSRQLKEALESGKTIITHPEKQGTIVLDFANDADEIKAAFEPYYETTLLSEATDPNLLYEIQTRLAAFPIYTEADVNAFAKVYFDPKATQDQLHAVLAPALARFGDVSKEEQHGFRGQLTDYVRLYAFLAQALTFADADLEKLYVFARYLRRLLPPDRDELPREVQQNIDMESYRIQETSRSRIAVERKAGLLDPVGTKGGHGTAPEELETLSRIIAELNERFGLNLGPEHRVTLGQMMQKLDDDAALDAAARVNTRENVRLTFDQKVEHVIQEIVDSNFDLYKRITDDGAFGEVLKNFLFDQYLRAHRNAEELIKRGESKTLELKSTLRWNLEEDRQDDNGVTHAALKTVAASLNTDGGDLLIGVADDGSVVGIERDRLESDDKFTRHLAQVVRNGLGDRAGTCIDPKTQIVDGRTVCVVSCQRSPEPVFLKWKGLEGVPEGDFFVRSGPGTAKLPPDSAREYIRTRFSSIAQASDAPSTAVGDRQPGADDAPGDN